MHYSLLLALSRNAIGGEADQGKLGLLHVLPYNVKKLLRFLGRLCRAQVHPEHCIHVCLPLAPVHVVLLELAVRRQIISGIL